MTSLATISNQTFTSMGLQTSFNLPTFPQMSIQRNLVEMSPSEGNYGPSKKLKTERNSSEFSQILEDSEHSSLRTDQISVTNGPKTFLNLPTPPMNTNLLFQTFSSQTVNFPIQFAPVQIPNATNPSMPIPGSSMLNMNTTTMENSIFNINSNTQTNNSELSKRLNLLNQTTPLLNFPQNSATLAALEANFNPYLQLQGDESLWKYLQEQQEDFDRFLKKVKNLVNSCASNPEDRIPEDFLHRGNVNPFMFRNRQELTGPNRRSDESERRVRERDSNKRKKRASGRTSGNKRSASGRTQENILE